MRPGLTLPGCGCTVLFTVSRGEVIQFCPLHEAAPDLLESLGTIVKALRSGWWHRGSGELQEGELQLAEHRIAKAKGEQS